MAVEMASATHNEIRTGPLEAQNGPYTAVAVFDGKQWSAICRELGIASDGDTPEEAVATLKVAIREALEVAGERGISAGEPLSDEALLEFLDTHQPPAPVSNFMFSL
jgi:predicted RNase H-like HicB family nuclease